jgi:hypothetical protein
MRSIFRVLPRPSRAIVLGFLFGLALPLIGASTAVALPDVPVGLGGNEPHTTVVNPHNPDNVVVSQGTALAISNDFGVTFPISVNAANVPVGYGGCGDDVLAFDAGARLWWSYLRCVDGDGGGFDNLATDDISVVVQQVNPITGALVGAAVDVTPANHFDDKQWIAGDSNPGSPFANNVYVHWTRFDTSPTAEEFSRCVNCASTNAFSAPAAIASGAGEGFRHQANIAVGPNGDIFASYHTNTCGDDETDGDVVLMRDSSGGANLAAGGNPPTGVFKTNVFGAGGAEVTCNRQPSPSKIPMAHFLMQGAAAPFVVADPTRPGNVYVIVNDDPNNAAGSGDDGDVLLARSTNNGTSFSVSQIDHAPQGPASLQVFPQGTADQDGNLAVFWYDTRRQLLNNAGTPADTSDDYWNLDTFVTVSRDGAQTFTNDFRINDAPFDPQLGAPNFKGDNPPTYRIGEYNGLAAANGVGYAAFTGNTAGGQQQILFDTFSIAGAFPDRFEPNESADPGVATDLGTAASYSEPRLTIHGLGDEDFFRVQAQDTGKLRFRIALTGRVADVDLQVLDSFENVVGTSSPGLDANDGESVAIPAVQGETYVLHVFPAPDQQAPFNRYDLNIVNTAVPVPFGIDLRAASDSGAADDDNVTNVAAAAIRLRVDDAGLLAQGIPFSPANGTTTLADDTPGFKVRVIDNGVSAGLATPVAGQPGVYEFAFTGSPLTEGDNSITARVVIVDPSDDPTIAGTAHAVGNGGESAPLLVVLDTTPPPAPAAPDLLASSDDAGINIDNITRSTTPAFQGTAEANSLVRILANGVVVGQGFAGADGSDGVPGDGLGSYTITVEPLVDGVYAMTAVSEDSAGNMTSSAALQVTIANQLLDLNGATADVLVDLDADTVTGFPGIPGGVAGIRGIPRVNLGVNGHALTVIGTSLDDSLDYTPTGTQAGKLVEGATGQLLAFTGVAGAFTVDPIDGPDSVNVVGTSESDAVTVLAGPSATVQVNAYKTMTVPIANVERLAITSGQGVDTIDVTAFDSVNANLFVDGGAPNPNKPRGDLLRVGDGSGGGRIKKQSGPVTGSGTVFVTYRSTGNATRIDYVNTERVRQA